MNLCPYSRQPGLLLRRRLRIYPAVLRSTQKFCIGGPDGKLNDNVNVESDECRTKYKVKYLSGPAPAPTPSPGGQTCGNVCFKDSDCLTSGGFGCTRCSSYDTGAHGTCY